MTLEIGGSNDKLVKVFTRCLDALSVLNYGKVS